MNLQADMFGPAAMDRLAPSRPQSVMCARDPEVLTTLLAFHGAAGAAILDVTANRRRMWEGVRTADTVTFSDADPSMRPDVVADFRSLPFPDASFDVVVFDPPHLPAAAASPASDAGMVRRYGLAHAPAGDNVAALFGPFLSEAHRVLRPHGILLAKIKDHVHNHRYQWMLVDFVSAVRAQAGLTACDLVVKQDPSAGHLMSSKWTSAHHVRNAHCWWVVVRKGGCQPRRSA